MARSRSTRERRTGETLFGTGTTSRREILDGKITVSGNVDKSTDPSADGIWQVDPFAANPINFPIRQWHADLFNEVKAAGLLITSSFSMELVYPPG